MEIYFVRNEKGDEPMFRGFYTAATGMFAQQRRTELLTNNMSNANTPGYKSDQSSIRAFPEMLLQEFGKQNVPGQNGLKTPSASFVGAINTGAYLQETMPAFAQGALEETGNTTDLALVDAFMPINGSNGKAASVFFAVANDQGTVSYTRNGNFTLDQQGYLTTSSGYYVLDDAGERIRLDNHQFEVGADGTITAGGRTVGTLGIAYAENPYILEKQGDGLYQETGGGELPLYDGADTEAEFTIRQGAIERSNVDPSRAMTDLMTAYRAFEANQKVLQAYDQSMQKAANEVGRI